VTVALEERTATRASGFLIREARDSDAPRLRALLRLVTERSGVRWSIEPGEDPFVTLRAETDGWSAAVAEDAEGRIIGFVSVAIRSASIAGSERRSCYVTNLKVLRERRGRGVGDALCRHAIDLCRRSAGDDAPILLLMRVDNEQMRKRVSGPRGLPKLAELARIELHSIPARHSAHIPVPGGLQVSTATRDDLGEMAAFSDAVSRQRQFSPRFDATGLSRWIESASGLDVSDFMVARRDGRIVGWIGWWDESAVRVVRIAGFTRLGAVRQAVQVTRAWLAGAPRPVGIDARIGCLRAVHARVPADRPDVLRSLITETARIRASDCSWLQVALDTRDPLAAALTGLRARQECFEARVTSPVGQYEPTAADDRPLCVDAALI
jgi:ribosomal protein S18 acetylase RimI-like enzyme